MLKPFAALMLLAVAVLAGCAARPPFHLVAGADFGQGGIAGAAFQRAITQLVAAPLTSGNAVDTLVNGDAYFPAMLATIRSAKHSVTLETYVFWSGETERAFAGALAERARAGVQVKLLVDWFGGLSADESVLRDLRAAGVSVAIFHRPAINALDAVDNRDHRKVLVVDGEIAFLGGAGIADEWTGHAQDARHFRDTQYRVRGPAVAPLQAAFAENWWEVTGEALAGDAFFPPLSDADTLHAQVVTGSAGESQRMKLLLLLSLAAARKSIRIESAYFVPDSETSAALIDARRRGVSVQILVPGRLMNHPRVRDVSRDRWGPLLKAGVDIFEYQPAMLHAKLLIIDDVWVTVGSSNIDDRSERLNDEADLNVLDAGFAAEQSHLFADDLSRSREITLTAWQHRPIGEQLRAAFLNIFGGQF